MRKTADFILAIVQVREALEEPLPLLLQHHQTALDGRRQSLHGRGHERPSERLARRGEPRDSQVLSER
jgi:hypothetical protein